MENTLSARFRLSLAGKILAGLGLFVVSLGLLKYGVVWRQARTGVETVAVIDKAWMRSGWEGRAAALNLHWFDEAGKRRKAEQVKVSGGLQAKLITDRALTRTSVRIRYQPEPDNASVIVVDDLHEKLAEARTFGLGGFALTALGSLLVLVSLLQIELRTRARPAE